MALAGSTQLNIRPYVLAFKVCNLALAHLYTGKYRLNMTKRTPLR